MAKPHGQGSKVAPCNTKNVAFGKLPGMSLPDARK